ncbi:unnamed protein product [Rotaria socialis]|uniref:Uncharacterized protein n=2 Tax=Rotaria socialis TaxID=392032 RepID=A0A820ATA1_9BILA|nr:unnamed protein product [Rotaria socialis]CAF4196907.1 unnamed protein product [Rotaria socialis]CAF4364871.1 unnamed protein product [Rotaria socialis]CAF4569161.1 unnamed protein product [Rotaria socialis]
MRSYIRNVTVISTNIQSPRSSHSTGSNESIDWHQNSYPARHNKWKNYGLNKVAPNKVGTFLQKSGNRGHEINHESLSTAKTRMPVYQDSSSGYRSRISKDRDIRVKNASSNRNEASRDNRERSNGTLERGCFDKCCCGCSSVCIFISLLVALVIGTIIAVIIILVVIQAQTATTSTTPAVNSTIMPIAKVTTTPLGAATTTPLATATATATSIGIATATPLVTATTKPLVTATTAPLTATSATSTGIATTTPLVTATTTPLATATATSTGISSMPSTTSSIGVSVLTSGNSWFLSEEVVFNCSATITNISIVTTVQKTVGAYFNAIWNTISTASITQSCIDNGAQMIYTWGMINGQTVPTSQCPFKMAADFNLLGTAQPTSGDNYLVNIEMITGQVYAFSGSF